MKKEGALLLNQLLIEMRKLADYLDESYTKADFEGVLKVKRQLLEIQKKIGGLV